MDPALRWRTLDTAHFSVHFAEQHRAQARALAEIAEAVYPRITGMLDWRPESRIELIVLDSADFANGIASPLPFNYSAIFLSPPDEAELLQNREWLELVLTHELFHIVHLDKAHGAPYSWRRIFGRVPLLFPNILQPRWIIEGLAVYAESDALRRQGRLEHSYFEAMMRAEVARGLRSLSEVNAEGRGFPLNREYLYGSYFFAFVRERYGVDAIRRFIENYSGKLVPFQVQTNAIEAIGKPMDELWLEFHDWLRTRFAPRLNAADTQEGEILERAFAIMSPTLAPGAVSWYIRGDGYTAPKLMRQADDASAEAVRDVELDARLAVAQEGAILMAQPDICGNYNYFYDLYRIGADRRSRRLTHCSRYRLAASLDDGRMAAVRVSAGVPEVLLLDARGTAERSLYRAADGEMLTGLATKASSIVITTQSAGRWSLIDISAGRASVLVSDEAVKHSPRFGDDGEIYFVADYGNVYDIWSLRRGERSLSRWTRSSNGVREISAPIAGAILLTTIEADGDALRLLRLPERPLERRDAEAPIESAPPQTKEAAAVSDRSYSPWRTLRPHAWLPIVAIGEGAVELGAAVLGQDALGLHRYYLEARYEFTQGEPLWDFEYIYDGRHGLLASRWMVVKAQDDDITAYSIREQAQWVSTWRQLSLNRRFYWGLGGALERERLHETGFGTSPLQDERVLGLVAGVDTRRERWYSEGPSQGQQLRLFAETSSGLGGVYGGNVYRADWRGYLALGKTVLALRWNEARGQQAAEPFQLGGSHSEESFTLPVLNEREFPLRGYTSGEPSLTGHRARVVTLEWRAPLADIDRHPTVPPLGMNRVALNLFAEAGAAWERDMKPDYHRAVGAELMSELRVGYFIGLHARAGIAKGLDAPGTTKVYVRLGRSF